LLAVRIDYPFKDRSVTDGKGNLLSDGLKEVLILLGETAIFTLVQDFQNADLSSPATRGMRTILRVTNPDSASILP